MPALNFKREFAPGVSSGAKRQTIRAWRKRPFRIGDTLTLFVDQRRPTCRLLGRHTCLMAIPIRLPWEVLRIYIGQTQLSPGEGEAFAQADGFASTEAMFEWFEKNLGLPFDGQLIMW